MTPREIYRAILGLNPRELRELRALLRDLTDEDDGGAGVREPRTPGPFSFPPARHWRDRA